MTQPWPLIPYPEWKATCTALHLWSQIIGKYRLAHTPWVNHSWHATLYVHPRGLTTGPVRDGDNLISLMLDFHDHALIVESSNGQRRLAPLEPMSVADFLARTAKAVAGVGGHFAENGRPNEVESPVRFADDLVLRPYEQDAVERFHRAHEASLWSNCPWREDRRQASSHQWGSGEPYIFDVHFHRMSA